MQELNPEAKWSNFNSDNDVKELKALLKKISDRYGMSYFEILKRIEEKDSIPATAFTRELSPLESVVRYLKEKRLYKIKKIALLLGRSEKTIWQAYNSSKKKVTDFKFEPTEYLVDVSVLSNRRFSILELVVSYLKENYKLSYHEIANLLQRNDRTVWTVYNRAIKKRENES